MANNQYVNKVVYGDQTLIDLTNDNVAANKMLSGTTAHDKSGASITGNIPTRNTNNIYRTWFSGTRYFIVDKGYYTDNMMLQDGSVHIEIPSSDTNEFNVLIPNGTLVPDITNSDDWIRLTIDIDAQGNATITDDTIPANGVSF